MNARSTKGLAIAAGVLLVGAFFINSGSDRDAGDNGLLLPGLEDSLDDVTVVRIAGPDGNVSIERREDSWHVLEKSGYPADIGKLRSALTALADARRLEAKTSQPGRHAQLGLDEASATRVAFDGVDGGDVLLGDVAQQRYRYARLAGDDQTWLIDQNPEIPLAASDWLAGAITDIPAADIASITLLHANGEEIRIVRGDDGEFRVDNVPDERELRYAGVINATTSALQGLELDDARPAEDLEVGADLTATYTLTDGIALTARRYSEDDAAWFTFDAEAPADAPLTETLADGEIGDDSASPSPVERAADIARRVRGWAYRLPTYKADALAKRWDDLLAEEAGDDDG